MPSKAQPAIAPYAAVFTDLPSAVDNFAPVNNSLVLFSINAAAAPPAGPPARAAIVVSIPIARLALPGLFSAQMPISEIPSSILLSGNFLLIVFFNESNF